MPHTTPLHWHAQNLWQQLEPLLPGLSVEVVARVDSTNSELLSRARGATRRQVDVLPCLLVAEHQSRGRGRQGKDWQSSIGASLTFSLSMVLRPGDWSGLSLAVGVALAEALDPLQGSAPPRLGIKWPNDLLLVDGDDPGRKLGGILIETVPAGAQRMAVVGVGLNVRPLPQPAGKAADAAHGFSLGQANLQELHPGMDAPTALARVALPLAQVLRGFEQHGFAALRPRFDRRDLLRGYRVTTTLADLPEGLADGVDDGGTLWLRTANGRLPVASGEVSIRRSPPPAGG